MITQITAVNIDFSAIDSLLSYHSPQNLQEICDKYNFEFKSIPAESFSCFNGDRAKLLSVFQGMK